MRWAVALDQSFFFFLNIMTLLSGYLTHDFKDQPTFPFTLPRDETIFACC